MKLEHCNRSYAFGPTRLLVGVRSGVASARRGRRCPAGAHAVAVGAQRRLRCDARPGVASQNSLRSLRSLRSDNCAESVHEARCARRPQAWPCRPRRARRPGRSQRTNSPQDCLSPCSPPRRHTNRPRRVPPAASHVYWLFDRGEKPWQQRRARAGRSAPRRRREAQGLWPRAQRASSTDSPRLFERSERSERSEFGGGPRDRASQGSRRASDDRRGEARSPARACLCRASVRTHSGRSWTAKGRKRTVQPRADFVRRGPREARRSN